MQQYRTTISNDNSMVLSTVICSAVCFLILGLPIPIASVIVANNSHDDPCQSIDSIGLSLANWLLGAGIVGLILILSMVTLVIVVTCQPTASTVAIFTLLILNGIFQFIYTTLGAVILFRSNMDCLTEGTDLGVMSMLTLVLYWLAIVCSCCGGKAKSSE